MKYNQYIPNTSKVSEIGLGAWQLGAKSGWQNMSENDAIRMVEKALDLGINFFDTSPNYGFGSSEERLGKALKNRDRDTFVINTKFGHSASGETNYSPKHIRESLEGSLERLQLDYIDSLIIHNPPLEILDGAKNAHYTILEQLKQEGKIKAYGASLDTFEEMKVFMETTQAGVIEAFFNILHQDTAKAFSLAKEKNVAIIAKIPLDSGWLSGKYNAKSVFNDVRGRWSGEDIETRAQLVEEVKKIIGPDRNLAQAAISFCLAYDAVSTVIPGSTNIDQLIANVNSLNSPLPKNLVKDLETFYTEKVASLHLPW